MAPGTRLIVSRFGGWKTSLGTTATRSRVAAAAGTAVAAVASSSSRGPFTRHLSWLWRLYTTALEKAPIKTQSLLLGIIWATGDMIAQEVEGRQKLDVRRVAFTALYGGAFLAPAGHVWYCALDRTIGAQFHPSTLRFVVAKEAADNLLFAPLHVAAFFSWVNYAVDGGSFEDLRQKLKKDYIPTTVAELLVWPIHQVLMFQRIPLNHQLMASNLLTLGEAIALPLAKSHDNWIETPPWVNRPLVHSECLSEQ